MSRRKSDKRTRFFGVLHDPWRKLIAIGLALFLWNYLHQQIYIQWEESFPLVFEQKRSSNHINVGLNSPLYDMERFIDADTREPITSITLKLKGPRRLTEELRKPDQLIFDVRVTENEVIESSGQTSHFVMFRLENVHHRYNREHDGLLVEMVPGRVRLELRERTQRTVRPSFESIIWHVTDQGQPVKNPKAFTDRIHYKRFYPEQIDVFGRKDVVEGITDKTGMFVVNVDVSALRAGAALSLPMLLAPPFVDNDIIVKPVPTVSITVDPERNIYLLQQVPVVLDYTLVGPEEVGKWEPVPKFVPYRIHVAAGSTLDSALFKFFTVSGIESPVNEDWVREHAQFRVMLRKKDLINTKRISRRPTIRLSSLSQLDQETQYLHGPDYLPGDVRPVIEIKRKKHP